MFKASSKIANVIYKMLREVLTSQLSYLGDKITKESIIPLQENHAFLVLGEG